MFVQYLTNNLANNFMFRSKTSLSTYNTKYMYLKYFTAQIFHKTSDSATSKTLYNELPKYSRYVYNYSFSKHLIELIVSMVFLANWTVSEKAK